MKTVLGTVRRKWHVPPTKLTIASKLYLETQASGEQCQLVCSNAGSRSKFDEEVAELAIQCSFAQRMGLLIMPTQSLGAGAHGQELHPALKEF